MKVSDIIKDLIKNEVETVLSELSREDSKQVISYGKWRGELFNPGGSGQPTSRIVYNIFDQDQKTAFEVYGNIDGWFLDARSEIYGPFSSPEKALSAMDNCKNDKS